MWTTLRGDGSIVLRPRRGGWSARVHTRGVLVGVLLLIAAVAVFAWSLTVGDFPVPLSDVLRSLTGIGSSDSDFIVRTLRLPRGLLGLLVGAAFGLSGAILQRVIRNPLASPDVIGINTGAAAAAVFVIVVLKESGTSVTVAALTGATASSIAVYLLAYKRGVTGYRFILVGIGMTAVMESVISYLLTRAEIFDLHQAAVWLAGSLNGTGWEQVRPVALALAVLVPVAVFLARQLRLLELGDDAARGLGGRIELARGGLLLAGVALAAISTSTAGPIAFVALVAPQISRRLVGGRSLALLPSAACGALLLVASDLVARRAFAPTELPVGILTAILGAPYLLYLLARANKIGMGG